jgi:beta-lactam-binding protein with PASTA domain
MKLARAKARIKRAHCSTGRVARQRNRKHAGRVIRQSPRPGAVRRRGFKVKLVVGRR